MRVDGGEGAADQAIVVSLEGVSKSYGSIVALEDVSVAFCRNGATGLLGPNGAGKTTLIRLLLGLIRPTSGVVKVFDVNVRRNASLVRRRIGYVPEGAAHITGATCVQFLTFAGTLTGVEHRESLRRAHEVLEFVGLGEARYRKVETLSQGLRARVKIAQALVHGPELLILDEPTAGLDPGGKAEILTLVRDIVSEDGITALVSSHLLEDIEFLCDRVAFLNEGRLLAHDHIKELTAHQEDALMVRYQGDTASFVKALEAEQLVVREAGPELLEVGGVKDALPVFRAARQSATRVRGVEPRSVSLESLFLEIVSRRGG